MSCRMSSAAIVSPEDSADGEGSEPLGNLPANPQSKILDLRGFDSSVLLSPKGGFHPSVMGTPQNLQIPDARVLRNLGKRTGRGCRSRRPRGGPRPSPLPGKPLYSNWCPSIVIDSLIE